MYQSARPYRSVAIWVYIGVAMLLIQVVLGGITRLTGSGLSITEWNVITGTLPPMNEQRWMEEYGKYQQTPQYALLNTDFTLRDFKFIFFWEWLHRFWARLIALVFVIPFIVFLARKKFRQDMIIPLLTLLLLGAMQGAIGWIMVASGLAGDAVYVKPTRLALHFVFALGLISYAWWFALQLSVPSSQKLFNRNLRQWSVGIIVLTFGQLMFGALMAGHKAATAAPTWPLIDNSWIPGGMFRFTPAAINIIENKITIHFIHRSLAYLLFTGVLIWTFKAYGTFSRSVYFTRSKWIPVLLIFIQVLLGIFTVLKSPEIVPNRWGGFEWLAQLHQVTGMIFSLTMIWMVYLVRPARK